MQPIFALLSIFLNETETYISYSKHAVLIYISNPNNHSDQLPLNASQEEHNISLIDQQTSLAHLEGFKREEGGGGGNYVLRGSSLKLMQCE